MITATAMTARLEGIDLAPLTLKFDKGRHALLGKREDGVTVLLACLAGAIRPHRGTLRVLEGMPSDPRTRIRVGYLPLALKLPSALRVDEMIAIAESIRGTAHMPADKVLAPLGLGALAKRRTNTLDEGEARAVALAEAIASPAVSVLLLEEPFLCMAPSAVAALPGVLQARKDTCLVVCSASAEDATSLASDFALFEKGKLLRVVTDAEAPFRVGEKARLHVVASDPRALAAELTKHTEVERLELVNGQVLVSGSDLVALGRAVNAAVLASNVQVERIQSEVNPP